MAMEASEPASANAGMENQMIEGWQRMQESVDRAFQRAEELSAKFEKTEKPRQRKLIEILKKHNLPAFVAPFFDAYFRITLEGGDIDQLSILMISRLSEHLGEDPREIAKRHKDAVADYVEFMSEDLEDSGGGVKVILE